MKPIIETERIILRQFCDDDAEAVFEFDSKVSAISGSLGDSIDYVTALGEMKFLLWIGRFYLLETAVNFVADYFLKRYPMLLTVEVAAAKKEALKEFCHPTLRVVRVQDKETSDLVSVLSYPDLQCLAGPVDNILQNIEQLTGETGYALVLPPSHPTAEKGADRLGKVLRIGPQPFKELGDENSSVVLCKPQESPYPNSLIEKYPRCREENLDSLFDVSFFNPVLHTYVK